MGFYLDFYQGVGVLNFFAQGERIRPSKNMSGGFAGVIVMLGCD